MPESQVTSTEPVAPRRAASPTSPMAIPAATRRREGAPATNAAPHAMAATHPTDAA